MSVFRAAQQIASFMEAQQVPYAFIGGLALPHWGEPRFTRDATFIKAESRE